MNTSLFTQLPQYWMQGALRAWDGFSRSMSEPFIPSEDPPSVTPYRILYEGGKARLRYYQSQQRQHATPLLIVYALIKRPFILDLQPGKSVVAHFLERGFDVYLLDWLPPNQTDTWRGFDAYVNQDLARIVQLTQRHAQAQQVSLLGYCFGALLATIYSALHPQRVKHLITLNLPLDFSVQKIPLFTLLVNNVSQEIIDCITTTYGNCPAWLVHSTFTAMAPVHHSLDKFVGLYRNSGKEGYAEMFALIERWMNSDVPLAGQIFRESFLQIFRNNLLAQNRMTVGHRTVDLRHIHCSVLNVVGDYDDVVHPESSVPLTEFVRSSDRQTLRFPTGHIGAVVSSSAHQQLWPRISAWLHERDHMATYE